MTAYFDNAATTKPCQECIDAVNEMLCENFGNASSLHDVGVKAFKTVEKSRQIIADAIGAEDKNEIFFTSGATEANNLAVFGSAYANKRKGNRIVTTAIEHESVLESINELEKEGFEVVRIMPDEHGNISQSEIIDAINSDTILVSVMLVNNEVGSITDVSKIKKAITKAKSSAYLHIDAVQAFGKLPFKVSRLGADLLSITAHKINGPKGVGALYVKKGVRIIPRTYGGAQQMNIRPGTESTPLIAGFAAAVQALGDIKKNEQHVKDIKEYAVQKLEGAMILSDETSSPYILSVSFPQFAKRSQTMIQALSRHGVYVSSGSACAKGKKSHVLTAMGLPNDVVDSALRISFSRFNTREEVDALSEALNTEFKKLAGR